MSCFRYTDTKKLARGQNLNQNGKKYLQIKIRYLKQVAQSNKKMPSTYVAQKSILRKRSFDVYEQLKEKLYYYYEQHKIDNAYSIAKTIKNHYQHQITNYDSKLISKIIREQLEIQKLQSEFQRDGWIEKHKQKGLTVMIRHEPDKTCSSIIEKQIEIPYQIMIAILTQIDLYSQYVPFCSQSRIMKKVSRNCRIAWSRHNFPLMAERDNHFIARAYDRLCHNGTIFMFVTDIANRKDLQEDCEYIPKINHKAVPLSYRFMMLIYTPVSQGVGNFKFIGNIDTKLNFLPNFIIEWMNVKFGKDYFPMLERISAKYKGSKWQQKVKEDPSVFNWNKKIIQQYLEKLKQDKTLN